MTSTPTCPITNAVHLCVDMQNIFARGGVWETPWMERVLPNLVDISARHTQRTVFTRFITPDAAADRPGRWQAYYRKWEAATRARLPSSQLELIPMLSRFTPPAVVIDKPFYSAFASSKLLQYLSEKDVTTLIVTGAETDVCVLSTTLSAVDYGYRVILVEDALCSSSDQGHDALMTMYSTRMSEQIELVRTEQLVSLWLE
jgi:nicotinamidase-related amidase